MNANFFKKKTQVFYTQTLISDVTNFKEMYFSSLPIMTFQLGQEYMNKQ